MTSFVPKGKVDLVADGSVLFPVQEEQIVENVVKEAGIGDMNM
jgi:hypothetical protein